jgi:hypothetical protein
LLGLLCKTQKPFDRTLTLQASLYAAVNDLRVTVENSIR